MPDVIACRSPQEIADDIVTEAHAWAIKSLNQVCNGKCLYTGAARERLLKIRDHAESLICQDAPVTSEQARKLTIMQLGFFVR